MPSERGALRWRSLKSGEKPLAPVANALSRLIGINELLESIDDTKNEWYRFSRHVSQVLEAIADILPEGPPSPRLKQCIDDLNKFATKLEPFLQQLETADKAKLVLQSSEATAHQLESLRQELHDQVKVLQLNLDVDQRKALNHALDSRGLQDLAVTITDIRNELTTIKSSLNTPPPILDTLPYASGASWDSAHACMPGTRAALLDEVMNWIQSPPSGNCAEIYWITGVAGSGKTAIANSICTITSDRGWLVSSFFFNRMFDERNKSDRFVTTIARDIAGKFPSVAETLAEKLAFDVGLRSTTDIARQFREFVVLPLSSLERANPAVIVIDALDEGYDDRLLDIFSSGLSTLSPIFRIVITSRPLPDISLILDDVGHVTRCILSTSDTDNQKDVRAYMNSRLGAIARRRHLPPPWPPPALGDALVAQAEGLFQWAFTVTEYLLKCLSPDRQLRLIASDHSTTATVSSRMDRLYATVLATIPVDEEGDFVQAYQMFMGAILAAKEPLTLAAIRSLHGVTDVDPLDLLDRLSSVVVGLKDDHKPVRILHLSLREYLTQRAITPFRLSTSESSHRLACLCVKLLITHIGKETASLSQLDLMSHTRVVIPPVKRTEISDGLYYAATYWTRHLHDIHVAPSDLVKDIHLVLNDCLDRWISLTICLGHYCGLRRLREWLYTQGVGLPSISNERWAIRLRFLSELLRRNGRLEEACAAAEDSVAAALGPNFILLAESASSTPAALSDNGTSPSPHVGALERGPLIARIAVRRVKEIETTASSETISVATLCLDQMAICLTAVGQLEEATEASEQVIKLRRALSQQDPAKYNSDLAWSLGNHSEVLARTGSRIDALYAIEEAIKLYRPYIEAGHDQLRENLAWSLGTFSKRLAERPEDRSSSERALSTIEEAVSLYRPLVREKPVVFGQNLAWALGTLSSRLADVKRYPEGVAAAKESVQLCRDLLGVRPADAMLPDLGLQLRNLASRLNEVDQSADALLTIDEAIALYRQQSRRLPLRYSSELMRCLYQRSTYLAAVDQPENALSTLEEAMALLRPLANQRPNLYHDYVELSEVQLMSLYTVLGRSEDAKALAQRPRDNVKH